MVIVHSIALIKILAMMSKKAP